MSDWHLARGFRYAGVATGLRSEPNRRDVAVVVSDAPACAAGAFTQNRVCAAPVQVSRKRLPQPSARAVVVCSGNANACTGERGVRDAERMAELVARDIGCSPEQVLVASTGVIGRPLPMAVLEAGIPQAVAAAHAVCAELARDIAADAEGAAHLVVLHVDGCRSDAEARQVAKAVAESALVKTAVFGADPNWGRVVSAAGYAGIPFEEKDLSLWLGDLLLYRDGTPVPFEAATA